MLTVAKGIFGEWLDRQYVAWQGGEGRSRTVGEFAEFLEFPRETVSRWTNGRSTPTDRTIADRLADKLGDEVYTVLGMEPTDPRLRVISAHWDEYPESKKDQIHQVAERGVEHGAKRKVGRKAKADQ